MSHRYDTRSHTKKAPGWGHQHQQLTSHRRTPKQAAERRAEKAKKATAAEYNEAHMRVFKRKWAELPKGKVAWPEVSNAEVLAELANKGGRRRTRRRNARSTRRR